MVNNNDLEYKMRVSVVDNKGAIHGFYRTAHDIYLGVVSYRNDWKKIDVNISLTNMTVFRQVDGFEPVCHKNVNGEGLDKIFADKY